MNAAFESNEPYLATVAARIGDAIYAYCRGKVGGHFRADELRQYVTDNVGVCAPGSADRILRRMRQDSIIGYTVVSRAKSLYRIDRVQQPDAATPKASA